MVFDFIKKRAQEGLGQASNIAKKTAEGKLGEGLKEAGAYTKETNKKFAEGLEKSRQALLGDLNALFGGKDMRVEETLNRLEEILMISDIGVATTLDILDEVRNTAVDDKLDPELVKTILRGKLIEVLEGKGARMSRKLKSSPDPGSPTVFMMIGANGMGKTTTVGKMASRFKEGGLRVVVGACDTFRAAAVEQLDEWSRRAEVDIVKPAGERAAAPQVVAETVAKGVQDGYDVVILDTSGRLSNNRKLNEQLREMKEAAARKLGRAPDETLLVVDAAVGRNAVDQAKRWNQDVGITGVVVTAGPTRQKAASFGPRPAKLRLPIKLVGVGEKIEDLRDFDPVAFVDSLLGHGPEEAARLQARLDVLNRGRREEEARLAAAEEAKRQEAGARLEEMLAASGPGGGGGGGGKSSRRKGKKKGGKK
ncbi:unnamed protein product [Heterosigma akashiwo]